jgi:hypothetical protein
MGIPMDEDKKRRIQTQVEMDQFMEVVADTLPEGHLHLLYNIACLAFDNLVLPEHDKEILKGMLAYSVSSIDTLKGTKNE